MMTAQDLYRIIISLIPLYISFFIGYCSVKWWKVFNQEQCSGISKFCSLFAVPVLSFYYITKTNLYEMNIKLFCADVLQKVIVLAALAYWYKLGPGGSIEWLITIFSICTLPNILILGVRFIKSMYHAKATPLAVEIFLAQSVIWHPLLLIMHEYRVARNVISQQFGNIHGPSVDIETTNKDYQGVADGTSSLDIKAGEVGGGGMGEDFEIRLHLEGQESSHDQTSAGNKQGKIEEVPPTSTNEIIIETEHQCVSNGPTFLPSASALTTHIIIRVWKKLIRNPNTYATIIGLVLAFVLSKFHIVMPLIVANSFTFLSNASLGMGMFNLGLSIGLQPTLIPCGKVVAAMTMVLRFIIGPIVMAFVSLAVGLHDTIFCIAVAQAAISQGVAPSVFAVEYNVHPEIFTIGMTLGIVLVLPVMLLYYYLLEI